MILNKGKFELDAYEECPCESGKKFKFCCRDTARKNVKKQSRHIMYPDGRINNMLLHFWEKTDFKSCYVADKHCKGKIKAAHSIQNNRILNKISEEGHVYLIDVKVKDRELQPYFSRISRNKASTFFGFCDYHDTELFKPIEIVHYKNTPEQNFLFAFRAFCVAQHKVIRKMKILRDIIKEFPEQLLNEESILWYRINQLDLRDGELEYNAFSESQKSQNFTEIKTYSYRLNYPINFAVSSSFAIDRGINNEVVQDTYNISPKQIVPNVYLNVFPVEEETVIIMSYNRKYDSVYSELFEQISNANEDELLKYLSDMIFDKSEDVYYRPSIVMKLNTKTKESLLASYTAFSDPLHAYEIYQKNLFFNFNLFNL